MKFLFILLLALPVPVIAMEAGTDYIVRHTIKTDFKVTEIGGVPGRKLKYFNGTVAHLTTEQAAKLKSLGYTVEKTIPIHVLGHPTTTAPKADLPWGIQTVQAPLAHKLPNGEGKGVTVCVVDTGIAGDHPVLLGSVVGGEALVKSKIKNKPEWYDDMGHGTHVSGTIAAHTDELLGVAPKASLYAVKVLDASGSGTDADVADGIKACIGHAKVINISLGGGEFSNIIQEALDAAVKAGIQIACAAGNESGPVGYPAAQRGCTAISAVDVTGKLASFSCFGSQVKFAAPGVDVKSSIPGGKFAVWDGTSMATPHVAGTMAVMLGRNKSVLKAKDLKLPATKQGKGEINTFLTAQ